MNALRRGVLTGVALVLGLGTVAGVRADQSAVAIDVPPEASRGSTITVTVRVSHEGNSFFHFTDWAWLRAGEVEIARWRFSADNRPEDENFTRQVAYTLHGPTTFTAQANCNVHGSAGAVRKTVAVAGGTTQPSGREAAGVPSAPPPLDSDPSLLATAILVLGIFNFVLILFQVATGRRWIRVDIAIHRRVGQLLVLAALAHGLLAVLLSR